MKHKYNIGDLIISGQNGRGIICDVVNYSNITEYVIYWADGQPTSMGYSAFEISTKVSKQYWQYYPVKK